LHALFEQIKPTDDEYKLAQACHTWVASFVHPSEPVDCVRLQGSYKRRTAIHPIGDVDILVCFKHRRIPWTPMEVHAVVNNLLEAKRETWAPIYDKKVQRRSICLSSKGERGHRCVVWVAYFHCFS
jgi:predicted nucleotidyltransferase